MERVFPKHQNCYKGNLHSHTTRSDGAYALEKVIQGYREKGYHFLCISDHHKYYVSNPAPEEEFVIIDGMEGEVGDSNYHIHALADYSRNVDKRFLPESVCPINLEQTPQETIDEYIGLGNICIINHPRWSKMEYEELLDVDHYLGIEIYNHGCDRESLTGYSVDYWDYLLRKGKRICGFASDDAHAADIDCADSEFFGGWIVVSAPTLNQQAIMDSMKQGDFYSSNGPAILSIEKEGTLVSVKTGPVKSIAFITYPEHGLNVYDKDGKDICEAQYKIHSNTEYVRIEITDGFGKKAWSNPIYWEKAVERF